MDLIKTFEEIVTENEFLATYHLQLDIPKEYIENTFKYNNDRNKTYDIRKYQNEIIEQGKKEMEKEIRNGNIFKYITKGSTEENMTLELRYYIDFHIMKELPLFKTIKENYYKELNKIAKIIDINYQKENNIKHRISLLDEIQEFIKENPHLQIKSQGEFLNYLWNKKYPIIKPEIIITQDWTENYNKFSFLLEEFYNSKKKNILSTDNKYKKGINLNSKEIPIEELIRTEVTKELMSITPEFNHRLQQILSKKYREKTVEEVLRQNRFTQRIGNSIPFLTYREMDKIVVLLPYSLKVYKRNDSKWVSSLIYSIKGMTLTESEQMANNYLKSMDKLENISVDELEFNKYIDFMSKHMRLKGGK